MAYHVRRSGATWVLAPDDDNILFRSFKRSACVATAREMARQIDDQVFVYDRNGNLRLPTHSAMASRVSSATACLRFLKIESVNADILSALLPL
jgi:hypothetical protein